MFKKISKKIFLKIFTVIKFNSVQRTSKKTLFYTSMAEQGCISCRDYQEDITKNLMTMKTTTNTSKNQNFSRKVREDKVEAIRTISFH